MEKREIVVGLSFPPHDDAAEVVEPGKEALDLPTAPSPPERSSVLGRGASAIVAMRRDHLDRPLVHEAFIQRIAVVRFVANQSRRIVCEEPPFQRGIDQGDFSRRRAGHVDGERKTMAVANCHNFAALPPLSGPDLGAPFFAAVKLASMNPSERSRRPRSRTFSARRCRTVSNTPVRCQCCIRR
jgi:hypothetical protein